MAKDKKSPRHRVAILRNQVIGRLEAAVQQGQNAESLANLADAVESLTSALTLMPPPSVKPGEAPPPEEEEV